MNQKPRFLADNIVIPLVKILVISGLVFCLGYLIVFNFSACPATKIFPTNFYSRLATNYYGTNPTPDHHHLDSNSPTKIDHLVFGLVTAVKTWRHRKPYIDSWWRPNITRGYMIMDRADMKEFLPWPSTSPPLRVSDDTSQLERESKHAAPIMVRMVHAILETFREGDEGVRWYVMAFEDSILFVDNLVDVLAKYDHNKYYYIGGNSETALSNFYFSFDMAFGGSGIILSYPLAAALVKDLKGCIRRYSFLRSHDHIVQWCVEELGVSLTIEKGIHQIDLLGDLSGFLSAHPQAPLISLHHFDTADPIFPKMDRYQSTFHIMKAGQYDQSRLLQQSVCYLRPRNWSVSISWGYSVHIYERYHPRSILKRPLETFRPWLRAAKDPKFMFNTRWPCETPTVFFFDSVEKKSNGQILTTYLRSPSPSYPNCGWKSNNLTTHISKVQVLSPATKYTEVDRSECCDIVRMDNTNIAELKIRSCMDAEIIS